MSSKLFSLITLLVPSLVGSVVFAQSNDQIIPATGKTISSVVLQAAQELEGLASPAEDAQPTRIAIKAFQSIPSDSEGKAAPNTLFEVSSSKFLYFYVLDMEAGHKIYRLQGQSCSKDQLLQMIHALEENSELQGSSRRMGVSYKIGRFAIPIVEMNLEQVGKQNTSSCIAE